MLGAVVPPDRHGAAEQLVAAGALHPVHAEVDAADADRVRRRPGPGRVVLRGDQPVPRVERYGDGCAEVDVAESDHQVGRGGDDLEHLVPGRQAVDPADELDVVRAPRARPAGPSAGSGSSPRAPAGRRARSAGPPRVRAAPPRPAEAARTRRRRPWSARSGSGSAISSTPIRTERTPSTRSIDPGQVAVAECQRQQVDTQPYGQVEQRRTGLDEDVVVAGAAHGELGSVAVGRDERERLSGGSDTPATAGRWTSVPALTAGAAPVATVGRPRPAPG